MRNLLGYVLWLLAVAITGVVVAVKYFSFGLPAGTGWLMTDPARSLLIAIGLSLISKWV